MWCTQTNKQTCLRYNLDRKSKENPVIQSLKLCAKINDNYMNNI